MINRNQYFKKNPNFLSDTSLEHEIIKTKNEDHQIKDGNRIKSL